MNREMASAFLIPQPEIQEQERLAYTEAISLFRINCTNYNIMWDPSAYILR